MIKHVRGSWRPSGGRGKLKGYHRCCIVSGEFKLVTGKRLRGQGSSFAM